MNKANLLNSKSLSLINTSASRVLVYDGSFVMPPDPWRFFDLVVVVGWEALAKATYADFFIPDSWGVEARTLVKSALLKPIYLLDISWVLMDVLWDRSPCGIYNLNFIEAAGSAAARLSWVSSLGPVYGPNLPDDFFTKVGRNGVPVNMVSKPTPWNLI